MKTKIDFSMNNHYLYWTQKQKHIFAKWFPPVAQQLDSLLYVYSKEIAEVVLYPLLYSYQQSGYIMPIIWLDMGSKESCKSILERLNNQVYNNDIFTEDNYKQNLGAIVRSQKIVHTSLPSDIDINDIRSYKKKMFDYLSSLHKNLSRLPPSIFVFIHETGFFDAAEINVLNMFMDRLKKHGSVPMVFLHSPTDFRNENCALLGNDELFENIIIDSTHMAEHSMAETKNMPIYPLLPQMMKQHINSVKIKVISQQNPDYMFFSNKKLTGQQYVF